MAMKQLLLNTFFRSDDTGSVSEWNELNREQFLLLLAMVVFALGFFALIVRIWSL